MRKINRTAIIAAGIIFGACIIAAASAQLSHKSTKNGVGTSACVKSIADTLSAIVADYPAQIGVALIIGDTDTIAVNNKNIYPMMSVFKVHQALAICDDSDRKGLSLDSLLTVRREDLDPTTWSPMLKEHPEPAFSLTVKDLLRYTLMYSDNNASNLMFSKLVDVAQTDSFMTTVIPRSCFRIAYTEDEMSADHSKAYANRTSPLGAAVLVNRLFTDSLVSGVKQRFIMETLGQCVTGSDRIAAPLLGKKNIVIAHKTGSGYTNEAGVLSAHNDVAYICLPNGVHYTLAVFVKDYKGTEQEAAKAISRISAAVYSALTRSM